LEKELNVLKHELVPKQVILKDEERKKLLEGLKIVPEQLPKILKKDPVVKALDAKEGDIIKITRKSPTAGITEYYRLVIK